MVSAHFSNGPMIGEPFGAVYLHQRSEGHCSQVAKLTASDGEQWDDFGNSPAVEGDTVAVGVETCCINPGLDSAYVFSVGAAARSHGVNCPGGGGFVPELGLEGCRTGGSRVTLTLTDGLGDSLAMLFLGLE